MYEKLKFPASARIINKEMIKIATFDLIPTEVFDDMLWEYFPEGEAFSLNFEAAGVESQLFLQNIGLIFYLVLVNIMFGVLHFLLIPVGRLFKVGKRLVDKLEAYLYFNGLIKFFMEIFFDVVLVASLNLQIADWETPFTAEEMSNNLSVVFIILVCGLPITYLLLVCMKPHEWANSKFQSRIGTVFDDLDAVKLENKERTLLFWPIMFFLRRVAFVIVVLRF